MQSWFTDIRRVALLASTTAALSLVTPLWNSIQQMAQLESHYPVRIISAILFACLFTTILPLFLFLLYRNAEVLRFPKHIRVLA